MTLVTRTYTFMPFCYLVLSVCVLGEYYIYVEIYALLIRLAAPVMKNYLLIIEFFGDEEGRIIKITDVPLTLL